MKELTFILFLIPMFSSCASPSKSELDAEVRRLCAIDGGINIYDAVKTPQEKFNQQGQINFNRPTQEYNVPGQDYIYKPEEHPCREGNPSMTRHRHKVLIKSDRKLLGESTSYGRGGGDIPGPREPSNYHCPPSSESSEIALFKKIFSMEGK